MASGDLIVKVADKDTLDRTYANTTAYRCVSSRGRNGGGTPPLFPPLGGVVVFRKMNIGI